MLCQFSMGLTSGKCLASTRLDGKTAVITGCNTGIGKVTAREFYRYGARVVMACRDITKAEEAAAEIKEEVKPQAGSPVGEVIIKKLDLSSLASVRECATSILASEAHIHILVNNAGVMMCPFGKTEDGFETQFGVNHLGHFLFTCLLLPCIINSAPARIITVSSVGHKMGKIHFRDLNWENMAYSAMGAYSQSKLANILFSSELARRLKDTKVTTYAVHPGVVKTELGRHLNTVYFPGARQLAQILGYFSFKTPEEGAQTTIHCALDKTAGSETGLYYSDCKVTTPAAQARDPEKAKKLWEQSAKLVGLDWDPFSELDSK